MNEGKAWMSTWITKFYVDISIYAHLQINAAWWRHQMETFSALLALRGIHRPPVNSPHKGQWRRAMMFSLICAWTNSWANNRDAGDLRRYSAHYDVIIMGSVQSHLWPMEFIDANFFVNIGSDMCVLSVGATILYLFISNGVLWGLSQESFAKYVIKVIK